MAEKESKSKAAKPAVKKSKKPVKESDGSKKIAAIRIRGMNEINSKVQDTLLMLNLHRTNYCTVFPNTKAFLGMLQKTKDYITWGEISEETFNTLVDKKGEEYKGRITDSKEKINYNKFLTVNNKKIRKFFRLNPPKKGFEKKGIKQPYSRGGVLGYRGEKINDLIKKMI